MAPSQYPDLPLVGSVTSAKSSRKAVQGDKQSHLTCIVRVNLGSPLQGLIYWLLHLLLLKSCMDKFLATMAKKEDDIYIRPQDMERQSLNVFRMRLLGAEVRGVHSGTRTLKDACSAAIRDWVTNVEDTHYILGSVAGPHPFPTIVWRCIRHPSNLNCRMARPALHA